MPNKVIKGFFIKINLKHLRYLRTYNIPIMEAHMFLNTLYGFKKDTFNLTWYFYEKAL